MQHMDLTPAEWRVMECLWERAPQTGREVTERMAAVMGWSRSTTLTLLKRLTDKGIVLCGGKATLRFDAAASAVYPAAAASNTVALDELTFVPAEAQAADAHTLLLELTNGHQLVSGETASAHRTL